MNVKAKQYARFRITKLTSVAKWLYIKVFITPAPERGEWSALLSDCLGASEKVSDTQWVGLWSRLGSCFEEIR